MVRRQDRFHGCILGAAAGDALGYCVDDKTLTQIQDSCGPEGIRGYDALNGYAAISSHTQLAMFTANGLLFGATRGATRGVMAPYVAYLEAAYREWLRTQQGHRIPGRRVYCWLSSVDEMYFRRSAEPAMVLALERPTPGTIHDPVNRSRGPGGLTRCAPVGLFLSPQRMERSEIGLLGAESAALTHGDPLGFLPAAYLVEIINRIVYDPVKSFREVLRETRASMRGQFGSQFRQLCALEECLTQAETMAAEDTPPALCLERLMPVEAPEVLAAACYVCLKYPGDFDRAILAAVNHSGHSAAVGCVAGAILGAILGTDGIQEYYFESLEQRGILEELAADLYTGCPLTRSDPLFDDEWYRKYVQCTY